MIYLILNDDAFLQLKNVPEYIVPETLKKMSGMERNKNKEFLQIKWVRIVSELRVNSWGWAW